jgi:hypothetical protein
MFFEKGVFATHSRSPLCDTALLGGQVLGGKAAGVTSQCLRHPSMRPAATMWSSSLLHPAAPPLTRAVLVTTQHAGPPSRWPSSLLHPSMCWPHSMLV